MARRLESYLGARPPGLVLAHVPSHKARKPSPGLAALLKELAREGDTCSPALIRRTRTIQKLAQGGDRDIEVHLASIKVVNPTSIRHKRVLVLDDVMTTGGSLLAVRRLIRRAGARRVWLLALGKTTR